MKYTYLLPIFFILFTFSACSEEEGEPMVETQLDKELKGEWSNYNVTSVYINDQEQVAHSDTSNIEIHHSFSKPNMTITHPTTGAEAVVRYELPDTSATRYIVITDSEMRQDVFEIKSLTETEMVWEKVLRYASYKSGDNYITSRRGVFTYKFRRL